MFHFHFLFGRCWSPSEDKTLSFHTGYGAEILRLVPDFRPEDVQNQGTGVLIQYPDDLIEDMEDIEVEVEQISWRNFANYFIRSQTIDVWCV